MTDEAHTDHLQTLQWYHCLLPSVLVHVLIMYAWLSFLSEVSIGTKTGDLPMPVVRTAVVAEWRESPKIIDIPAVQPETDPFEEPEDVVTGPMIQLPQPDASEKHDMQPDSMAVQNAPDLPVETSQPDSQNAEPAPHVEASAGPVANDVQSGATDSISNTGHQNADANASGVGPNAAVAGSGKGNQLPDESVAWRAYTKTLSAHFKKFKFYPEMARKQRLSGTVMLAVVIRRDGVVEDVQIEESSGSALLDQAAVQSAGRASPVPPFPADVSADSRKLLIPYRYQITE